MKINLIVLIMAVFAFVCFVLDTFAISTPSPRMKLESLGLAFLTLALILQGVL